MVQVDSEQSLPSALGHPGGLACQVPGRAWLRPPRTRTGRLALTSGRVACQRHPIPRHEIGSENRCRWTLRMCILTHIRVYTTNDTPRGHQYHTTTIVSPGARGRGRPGGTQQSKGIYSGYFCLLPLLLKLVNLDLAIGGNKGEMETKGKFLSSPPLRCPIQNLKAP